MNTEEFSDGLRKEDAFRRTCRNHIVNSKDLPNLKCQFLHNHHPYLKMGPFKIEHLWSRPYRAKIHDFFSNSEMDYLVKISKPHLSEARLVDQRPKVKGKQIVRLVHKTVQFWIEDIIFRKNATFNYLEDEEGFKKYRLSDSSNLDDYDIGDENLYQITKRIELATKMNLLKKFSSSRYQVIVLHNIPLVMISYFPTYQKALPLGSSMTVTLMTNKNFKFCSI